MLLTTGSLWGVCVSAELEAFYPARGRLYSFFVIIDYLTFLLLCMCSVNIRFPRLCTLGRCLPSILACLLEPLSCAIEPDSHCELLSLPLTP